jgi:hypothetical protein
MLQIKASLHCLNSSFVTRPAVGVESKDNTGQTDLSMIVTQSGVPESFRMELPLYAIISGQPIY